MTRTLYIAATTFASVHVLAGVDASVWVQLALAIIGAIAAFLANRNQPPTNPP